MITELKLNQIFCYGRNANSFHGTGAAGFAFSGTTANNWRTCPLKQSAIKHPNEISKTTGLPNKMGRWNVWGADKSFQEGFLGKSYGITTVIKPGGPRETLDNIRKQFSSLFRFAEACKNWEFLMTAVGTGYGGYTHEEINKEWRAAIDSFGSLPHNIVTVGGYV